MEMVLKHANEESKPPSARSELTIPPELAERLRAVETGELWTPEQAKKWWALHRRDNGGKVRPRSARLSDG